MLLRSSRWGMVLTATSVADLRRGDKSDGGLRPGYDSATVCVCLNIVYRYCSTRTGHTGIRRLREAARGMGRIYVFADEAGNFNFDRSPGASRYFILITVTLADCSVGHDLLELRRQLAWEGVELTDHFHATEETQAVRDRVFAILARHDFRVDSTIFDKPKVRPHLRADDTTFYKYVAAQIAEQDDELLVIAASLGTKRRQIAFRGAVRDVVLQVAQATHIQTAFWPAAIDPCLQVADYCCWAIQRKWERGDNRSHVLIAEKIASELDIFRFGSVTHY
jgi:hypothetical protein